MASRTFAAIVLFSVLCPEAWAQTAVPPAPAGGAAPAGSATPAAPADSATPQPSGTSPPAASPAPAAASPSSAPAGRVALPTIEVSGAKRKLPAAKPKPVPPAPSVQSTPAPVPPSPYQTGAPNVAGGTPVMPQLASQTTISGADLNARPVARPGEILEAAPGLAVVMHADGGKANQYYLRGYNLDHGTDMATFVDDVPINLPTHAHGQGYTDLNFLIPETVSGLEVRKGPYFADVGDFANAGTARLSLRDTVDQSIESITLGSFGYYRMLTLGSTKAGDGNLLYAGEFNTYNGPWRSPDDVKKFNGLLRYSQGTATDGLTATAMAYTNTWNSTDQVPLRAFTTGQMGLYGEQDPTDGGDTNRFSLSARLAKSEDDGAWNANAYLVKYNMNLFNNYTWHLDDFTNGGLGDQFHQHDDRIYGGADASRTLNGSLFNMPTQTVIGVQSRYDDINIGLSNTFQRQFLSNVLFDHVNEGNAGIYAENTVHWTDWLRTTTGWRGDYFDASVNSTLQPANSGKPQASIGSPKFTMTLGPFDKTEFFLGAGMGYHSNDARSVTATQTPGDPATPEGASPFLVRSRGAEIGVRTKLIPDLDSSVSLFYLHQDSELFFDGDTGETTAGLPSQRTGIEFTNDYHPASWAHFDADLALTRARFLGFDATQEALFESLAGTPQAQIGDAPGNFIYNAPWMVASAGLTLGEKTGWFSSLRWRYISSRPLTEDGVFQSPPSNIFNAAVGFRFDNGWSVTLDALNLLDSTTDLATYAYGSLLTSDGLYAACKAGTASAAACANGVMDYVYHPIEPTAFRLTLAGPLDTIGKVNMREMATELGRSVSFAPVQAANYDWTGFHVGAHLNTSRSGTSGTATDNATGAMASANGNMTQWGGGLQLGYDYMLPSRVVLGVAADVSSGNSRTVSAFDASGTSSIKTTVFDSETLGGRLGYAFDNLLLYGTGGWAWSNGQFVRTQLSGTLNLATAGTDEAVNKYLSGWTLGGGAALAIAENWNVFAEYRYTNFGLTTFTLPFSELTENSKTKVGSLELGVNYKFNWNMKHGPGYITADTRPLIPLHERRSPYPYNWSGIYLGGDGGYGWQTENGALTDAAGGVLASYGYRAMGPFAGGFAGANYQFNHIVAGIEGDWQRANLIGNNQTLAPIVAGAEPFTISSTTKDYGSLRGRLGLAADRLLVFGTAGWAWGNPQTEYAAAGSAPFAANGGNFVGGWTAGAGLEYALTDNVLGRVEYRYTDLAMAGFANPAAGAADAAREVPINDLRAGFAYKFGSDLFAAK